MVSRPDEPRMCTTWESDGDTLDPWFSAIAADGPAAAIRTVEGSPSHGAERSSSNLVFTFRRDIGSTLSCKASIE